MWHCRLLLGPAQLKVNMCMVEAPSFHDGNVKVLRNIAAVHMVPIIQRTKSSSVQVQAEQALQNITAAMEQASGHRQEAAVLKNQLAADQVILPPACSYMAPAHTHPHSLTHSLTQAAGLLCTQLIMYVCCTQTSKRRCMPAPFHSILCSAKMLCSCSLSMLAVEVESYALPIKQMACQSLMLLILTC